MRTFLQFISEGNPLARHVEFENKGHAYVGISAVRKGNSDSVNRKNMGEMESKIKKLGYGYRKTKGMWLGGEEDSFTVYAKKPGKKHSDELFRHMHQLASHYDQDSILHHDGKSAKLHGTNDTGFPGRGNQLAVGTNHYNKQNPDGMTGFKPNRKPEHRPILAALTKLRQPNRKPNLP